MRITDLTGEVSKSGVSKPNLFTVIVSVGGASAEELRPIAFRCEAAEIPGRSVATTEYKDWGVPSKIGYAPIYADLGLTLLLSEDLREKKFFEAWQDAVIGDHRVDQKTTKGWNTRYYDNYVGTVEIQQKNQKGEVVATYKLEETFPLIVNPVSLDWNSTNEVSKLQVSMAYKYYTTERAQGNSIIQTSDLLNRSSLLRELDERIGFFDAIRSSKVARRVDRISREYEDRGRQKLGNLTNNLKGIFK